MYMVQHHPANTQSGVHTCTCSQTDGRVGGWMDGQMDGWRVTEGRRDGGMEGWKGVGSYVGVASQCDLSYHLFTLHYGVRRYCVLTVMGKSDESLDVVHIPPPCLSNPPGTHLRMHVHTSCTSTCALHLRLPAPAPALAPGSARPSVASTPRTQRPTSFPERAVALPPRPLSSATLHISRSSSVAASCFFVRERQC